MAGGSGGAWKVAYADFVTAMMALFMVLWILGSEQETLEMMQEYFRNPPSPWERESNKHMIETGEFQGFSDLEIADEDFFNSDQASILRGIRDSFEQLISTNQLERKPPIDVSLLGDELRIAMYNRDDISLFRGKTTVLTEWGEFMLMNIAWLLTQYELKVTVESFIGPNYQVNNPSYGPFELTSDRSNKVRRSLEYFAQSGIEVKRVVGFGNSEISPEGGIAAEHKDRTVISLSVKEQMTADDFERTREIQNDLKENQKPVDLLDRF